MIDMNDFDYSKLTVADRLLLAQELLDSVYDDVTPPALNSDAMAPFDRAAA